MTTVAAACSATRRFNIIVAGKVPPGEVQKAQFSGCICVSRSFRVRRNKTR